MEEAEDIFETQINLNSSQKLESRKLEKSMLLSCIIEDNIFKITARGEEEDDVYLIQFTLPDYVQREEKEFIKRIKNFKLLVSTIKEAYEKKRLTLYSDGFSLMLTLYYTIIFKEEQIAFELHKQLEDPEEEKRLIGQFFSESKPIEADEDIDYRAELVEYTKNFEDLGDRSIIRVKIKNVGNTTWIRKITSFKCVPEFSSLLCNEYFLEEDIIPGDSTECDLEFMKGDPDNLEPPYYTFLHLHILNKSYEPMLILDFNESFKDEINRTNLKLDKSKIYKKKDKIKKDEEEENKINIIKKEKENKYNDQGSDNENQININNEKEQDKKKKKDFIEDNLNNAINMDEDNKSKIVFNNVKVNISFNVENLNKIICVDVNENQVKFNVDRNIVNIVDKKKNKIHIEEKKVNKQIKPSKNNKEKEEENLNKINYNNQKDARTSISDRIKFFSKNSNKK